MRQKAPLKPRTAPKPRRQDDTDLHLAAAMMFFAASCIMVFMIVPLSR